MLKQTSPNELIALTLLEAQALVEKGWDRYNFTSVGGGIRSVIARGVPEGACFCAAGAIGVACGQVPYDPDATLVAAACECLGMAIGTKNANYATIGLWNAKANQAEVVEAFGRAAELARAS